MPTPAVPAIPGPGSGGVPLGAGGASSAAATKPTQIKPVKPVHTPPPVGAPMGQQPMASWLGQHAGNFANPMLAGLLSVPQVNQFARGALSIGGAPLMLGLADMGSNFKNFKTLTQGAWQKQAAVPAGVRQFLGDATKTLLGAGIGAAASPLTQQLATDASGRELSTLGANVNTIGNAAAGALIGNPHMRRFIMQKDVTGNTLQKLQRAGSAVPVGAIPNVYKTRMLTGPATVVGVATAPTSLAYMSDTTKRVAEKAHQFIDKYPEIADSDGIQRTFVDPAIKGLQESVRQNAPSFLGPLGLTLGAVGAGMPLGYVGGSALMGTLLPDNDKLEYADRRRREQLRTLAGVVGGYGGALGAGYLANRYAPQLAGAFGQPAQ